MVVSRCRGTGPPSDIPSSGLCFCCLPIFVVIQLQTSASPRARLTTPIYENPSRRLAISQRAACVQACTADRRVVTHPSLRQTVQAQKGNIWLILVHHFTRLPQIRLACSVYVRLLLRLRVNRGRFLPRTNARGVVARLQQNNIEVPSSILTTRVWEEVYRCRGFTRHTTITRCIHVYVCMYVCMYVCIYK